MDPATVPLHPDLAALAPLVGTFEGDGAGDYPTIAPFGYRERITIAHVGRPFLAYEQRTWNPDSGAPMHAERGYLRAVGADRFELVLAHPTGVVEIEEGALRDRVLELRSTTMGASSTAKPVRSLRRRITVDADTVSYDLWMGYAEVEETHHLRATLHRVP